MKVLSRLLFLSSALIVFAGFFQTANAQWRELGPVSVLSKYTWVPDQCNYRLRFPSKELCFSTLPPECTDVQRYVSFQEISESTTLPGKRNQASHDWYALATIWQTPGGDTGQFRSFIAKEDLADYEAYVKSIATEINSAHGFEVSLDVSDFKNPTTPHAATRNVNFRLSPHQSQAIASVDLDRSKVFIQEFCPNPSPSPLPR